MASSEMTLALQKRRDLESGKIWASYIRPYLYLGSGRNASNLEKLQGHKITHIINVADDVENFHEGEFIYLNLGIADFGQDPGISRCFKKAKGFVNSVRKMSKSNEVEEARLNNKVVDNKAVDNKVVESEGCQQGVVLVHCANGSNRSVTVVVALLMMIENLSLKESMEEVRRCRPSARPLKDNWKELENFEKRLFSKDNVNA